MIRLYSDSFRRIKALIIKESYQIVRDPSTILISVVFPAMLLFLYGFGMSLDLDRLRIGLVLEDTAPEAISFAKALTDSPYFDVTIARDRRQLDEQLMQGAVRGIVVVPAYFSQFRKRRGIVAPIQVIADGSETNTASFVQNYVRGAWENWLQQEQIDRGEKIAPGINPQTRFWYNEQLESRYFIVPGSLAIIISLIGTLLTALVVAREWERGTMEALMATPVGIFELLIGKLVPYFVLGMVSMAICVTITVFLYHVPLRGSAFVLMGVSGIFLCSALGLGLLISTIFRNQFVAAQAAVVAGFLPAYMLSGFLFEIASMPPAIQMITYIISARYLVTCLQTLFLVGNIWPLLIKNILPMVALGLFFFLMVARKTAKRLD